MLHMHFEYLKKPAHGYLLTDEHDDMLLAIRNNDVERADNGNYIRHQVANAHLFQRLKINERWWTHPHTPGLSRAV